jgi:hypothetical protein
MFGYPQRIPYGIGKPFDCIPGDWHDKMVAGYLRHITGVY